MGQVKVPYKANGLPAVLMVTVTAAEKAKYVYLMAYAIVGTLVR